MNKNWKNTLHLLWLLPLAFFMQSAQHAEPKGYNIDVTLNNFDQPYVILAYNYGDKPYIKDTIYAKSTGKFVFEGKEKLDGGMYMIVMPPQNNTIEFFIDTDNQHFSIDVDVKNPVKTAKFKKSKNNTIFYKYLAFLNAQRAKSDKISAELKAAKDAKDQPKIKELEGKLIAINDEVIQYQKDLIKDNPNTFAAKFVQTSMDITVPDDVDSSMRYWYYRNHYFDNLDLSDGRLLRTPLLPPKVERYLDQVITQNPDSVIAGVDEILRRAEKDEDIYKYFLIRLINKYAKSKVICMDAVYVHIAKEYYLKGKANWIDQDQLTKIEEDAKRLEPLLCNKIAPDITMQTIPTKEGETPKATSLHGVNSKYTVLIFWASDCGHCKKSMPKVAKFYDEYKDRGVTVFSVCTKTYKDYQSCIDFVKEKDMTRMLNVCDPYLRSKFPILYDVKSTPVIFLLDENKKILAKRLAAEQLGEVIDNWDKILEQRGK